MCDTSDAALVTDKEKAILTHKHKHTEASDEASAQALSLGEDWSHVFTLIRLV